MVEVMGRDLRTLGRITQPAAEYIADKSDPLMDKARPIFGDKVVDEVGKVGQFATTLVADTEHPELMFLPVGGAGVKGTQLLYKHAGKRLVAGGARAFRAARSAGKGMKTAGAASRIKAAGVGFKRGVKEKRTELPVLEKLAASGQDVFKRFSPATRVLSKRYPKQTGGAMYAGRGGRLGGLARGTAIRTETALVGNELIKVSQPGPVQTMALETAMGKDFYSYGSAYDKVYGKDKSSSSASATHQKTVAPAKQASITRDRTSTTTQSTRGSVAATSQERATSQKSQENYHGTKKKKSNERGLRFHYGNGFRS